VILMMRRPLAGGALGDDIFRSDGPADRNASLAPLGGPFDSESVKTMPERRVQMRR